MQSVEKRWADLLKSKRFRKEHEGKDDSHGLSPGGHCKGAKKNNNNFYLITKKKENLNGCELPTCPSIVFCNTCYEL